MPLFNFFFQFRVMKIIYLYIYIYAYVYEYDIFHKWFFSKLCTIWMCIFTPPSCRISVIYLRIYNDLHKRRGDLINCVFLFITIFTGFFMDFNVLYMCKRMNGRQATNCQNIHCYYSFLFCFAFCFMFRTSFSSLINTSYKYFLIKYE